MPLWIIILIFYVMFVIIWIFVVMPLLNRRGKKPK